MNGQARKLGVQFEYNARGYQHRIVNAQDVNDVHHEVLAMNARGQVTQDRRGGAAVLTRDLQFDVTTGRLIGIGTGPGYALQNLDYGRNAPGEAYDPLGNLLKQKDVRTGVEERFVYDALHRLQSAMRYSGDGSLIGGQSMSYDGLGNLRTKGAMSLRYGSYGAHSQQCARSQLGPHMAAVATEGGVTTVYCHDAKGNQVSAGDGNPNSTGLDQRFVSYSVFDQPTQIRTTGTNSSVTRYAYGPGREIVRRTEGPTVTLTTRSTHYVGGVEVSYLPNQGSVTDRREYKRTVGSALIITMEIERNGTAVVRRSDRAYRFVDRQGSVDVLTDRSGTVLQRMGFDAFGQRREAGLGNPWAPSQIAGFDSRRTRKGYTGHEMVDHANLIHMGGRVYDPRLGRFLSADPLVQAPMQSQSWNRYTYVLNNPLNYTDPSGYAWIDNKQNQQIFRTVVSIAVVAFAPQMLGVANHAAMTAGQKIFIGAVSGAIQTGTLRGALISAFSAGVSHGIGGHFDKAEALNGGTLSIPDTVKKIMAHAVAGGVAETLRGGKFGHGFASAGFVELAGPHVSTALGGSAAGQIVTSAILGGTASHLVGGKFANGAATAAMQWAFNELGSQRVEDIFQHQTEIEMLKFVDTDFPQSTRNALQKILRSPLGQKLSADAINSGEKIKLVLSTDLVFAVLDDVIFYTTNVQGWLESVAGDRLAGDSMDSVALDILLAHEIGHTSIGSRAIGQVPIQVLSRADLREEEFRVVKSFENPYRRYVGAPPRQSYFEENDVCGGRCD